MDASNPRFLCDQPDLSKRREKGSARGNPRKKNTGTRKMETPNSGSSNGPGHWNDVKRIQAPTPSTPKSRREKDLNAERGIRTQGGACSTKHNTGQTRAVVRQKHQRRSMRGHVSSAPGKPKRQKRWGRGETGNHKGKRAQILLKPLRRYLRGTLGVRHGGGKNKGPKSAGHTYQKSGSSQLQDSPTEEKMVGRLRISAKKPLYLGGGQMIEKGEDRGVENGGRGRRKKKKRHDSRKPCFSARRSSTTKLTTARTAGRKKDGTGLGKKEEID